jgi:muramidase (phage lysozyme)
MANAFKGLLAGAVVGAIAWSFREYQKGQDAQAQAVFIPASTPQPSTPSVGKSLLSSFLGNLLDTVPDSVQDAAQAVGVTSYSPSPVYSNSNSNGSIEPLLNLIKQHESRGDYNIYWGGISTTDKPPRALTQMTIGQVLAWQDSIDAKYNSEAAGAYQMLEDTLRGLYGSAGLSVQSLFNTANQDKLAIALLNRRGLASYKRGALSAEQFGQNLSKEWASLPAQTSDKKGRAATGQSYYAGDGLNHSLTSKADVLAAIGKI